MDKIDLVYTWVDDSDSVWQKKKSNFLKQNSIESESNNKCRFKNNDELKYSLRSVGKYAPWINHIYIITDNQVPEWLDTNNPKITIVNHSDIMPLSALPTFNSIAIESCMVNIPNLSEYFLYANDDMFFAKETKPEFFYDKKGYPVCRFSRPSKKPDDIQYYNLIHNSQNLIYKKFKKKYCFISHHNIDAYRKSDVLECQKIFSGAIQQTIYSNFRDSKNLERILYLYYACAINHGREKLVKKVDTDLPLLVQIMNRITKKWEKDSLYIEGCEKDILKVLNRYNPYLFCINDTQYTSDDDRNNFKLFLKEYYPQKSEFEK